MLALQVHLEVFVLHSVHKPLIGMFGPEILGLVYLFVDPHLLLLDVDPVLDLLLYGFLNFGLFVRLVVEALILQSEAFIELPPNFKHMEMSLHFAGSNQFFCSQLHQLFFCHIEEVINLSALLVSLQFLGEVLYELAKFRGVSQGG